jgi:hypothetical protein
MLNTIDLSRVIASIENLASISSGVNSCTRPTTEPSTGERTSRVWSATGSRLSPRNV